MRYSPSFSIFRYILFHSFGESQQLVDALEFSWLFRSAFSLQGTLLVAADLLLKSCELLATLKAGVYLNKLLNKLYRLKTILNIEFLLKLRFLFLILFLNADPDVANLLSWLHQLHPEL